MTIEQMKGIAKEHMNKQISYLVDDVITADEARATLVALFYVELFSSDEFSCYWDRIRQVELESFSIIQLKNGSPQQRKAVFTYWSE